MLLNRFFFFLMANCGESTLDANCKYKLQPQILRNNILGLKKKKVFRQLMSSSGK